MSRRLLTRFHKSGELGFDERPWLFDRHVTERPPIHAMESL